MEANTQRDNLPPVQAESCGARLPKQATTSETLCTLGELWPVPEPLCEDDTCEITSTYDLSRSLWKHIKD